MPKVFQRWLPLPPSPMSTADRGHHFREPHLQRFRGRRHQDQNFYPLLPSKWFHLYETATELRWGPHAIHTTPHLQ